MRAIAAVVLAAGLVLGTASAASAAGIVQLSDDGSSWSSALGSPLFSSAPELVPMSNATATFWVRNASPDPAYLRLTVDNLNWSGPQYASALSIATSVPGTTGSPLALGSASGCLVLLDGVLLAAGQSVKVTTTLALGDLQGQSGQSGLAAMNIGVGLEQATGSAPSPGCNPSVPPTPVVVVPSGSASAGTPATAQPDPTDDGGDEVPPLVPGDSLFALLANTLVRFDGSLIGWATAGVVVGAALFFLVPIIRRLAGVPREEIAE